MIYFIIGICAIVLVWLFFPRKMPKGKSSKTKSAPYVAVTKAINFVRRRGLDNARIIIGKQDSNNFIQFIKKMPNGSPPNVVFYFPIADFSAGYVDILKKELVSAGIEYRIREADRSLPLKRLPAFARSIQQFVEVDSGVDMEKALMLLDKSLTVWGLSKNSSFDIFLFTPFNVFNKAVGFEE